MRLDLTDDEADVLGWAVIGALKETRTAAREATNDEKRAGYQRTETVLQGIREKLDRERGYES
jgi:hypothetical protein